MVKSCPRSISHSYPYRTIYMRRAAASCGNLNFIVNWFCLRNFVDWDSFSIICEANGGILLQVPLREAWQTFFHVYIRWWINIIWGGQWCQSSGSSSKGLVDLFFLNNYGNSVFHLYYLVRPLGAFFVLIKRRLLAFPHSLCIFGPGVCVCVLTFELVFIFSILARISI